MKKRNLIRFETAMTVLRYSVSMEVFPPPMLRFLPFDRLHLPSKGTPVRSSFQNSKLEPQTAGIGIITLLMVGLTVHVSSLNLVEQELALIIETIAQQTTTSSNPQRLENCQPHEVFRVSDRQCHQSQGE